MGINSSLTGFILTAATLLLAAILGYATSILPLNWVLSLVGIICIATSFALWPQGSLVILLIVATGTIPFIRLDFRAPLELAIIAATVICLYKSPFEKENPFSRIQPFAIPLLLLLLAWLVALYIGYFSARNSFALADARRYVGWIAFIPLFYYSHSRSEILLKAVIGVSIWASFLLAFQLFSGLEVLRSTSSLGLSDQFADIKRGNISGGSYLLAFTTFYSLVRMASARHQWASPTWLLVFLMSGIGHIAVFSRGVWAGLVLGTVFLIFALPGHFRNRVIAPLLFAIAALFVAGAAIYPFAPSQVNAFIDRATGFEEEGKKGTSLGARFDENEQALEVIPNHILTGLGHGGEYKRVAKQVERGFVNEAAFIHNSYLWVALKFGLLGIIPILWLVFIQLKRSWIQCRSPDPSTMAVGVSLIGAFITMLINGFSSPIWAQPSDLVAFATLATLTTYRESSAAPP